MAFEILNLHPAMFVWLLLSVIVFIVLLSAACYVTWKEITVLYTLAIVAACVFVSFNWPLMVPFLVIAGCYKIYGSIKERQQFNAIRAELQFSSHQNVSQLQQIQARYLHDLANTVPGSNSEISELDQSTLFSILDENLDYPPYLMNTVSERVQHQLPIIYVDDLSKQVHKITDESMCPICLTIIDFQDHGTNCPEFDIANNDDPCATTCDHVLHYGCLWEWLMTNPSCPTCRKSQTIKQCVLLRTIEPIVNITTYLALSESNIDSPRNSSTGPTTKLTTIAQMHKNMLASAESLVSNASFDSELMNTVGMFGAGHRGGFYLRRHNSLILDPNALQIHSSNIEQRNFNNAPSARNSYATDEITVTSNTNIDNVMDHRITPEAHCVPRNNSRERDSVMSSNHDPAIMERRVLETQLCESLNFNIDVVRPLAGRRCCNRQNICIPDQPWGRLQRGHLQHHQDDPRLPPGELPYACAQSVI